MTMWATGISAAVGVGTTVYNHNNQPNAAVAPTLAAPATPGAVSGTYGGSYIDPVTGRVVYASNTTAPTAQAYLDQNTYNRLMGYGGANQVGSDLNARISSQQATLDALKKQGAGTVNITDFVDPKWVGSDGKVIDWQQYINKRGDQNPLWGAFMANTGGNYGSKNPDISFGKWAKDSYNRYIVPKITDYENATKVSKGNQVVYDQQVRDAESQLNQLKGIQEQITGGASGASNPMLDYLEHGPNQANYISQQMTDQYKNAMNTSDQQNAMRGMGGSSMSELAHAQGANQLSQNILGAQVTGASNNYNDRLKMLQFLQGNKAQDQGNQVATGGLYNQQMGMGQGIGQNMSNQTTQQQAAQLGLNMNANQANTNAQLASNAALTNGLTSAAGAVGNAYGQYNSNQIMQNWLNNQNRVNSNSATATSGMSGNVGMTSNGGYGAATGTGSAGTDGWGY